MTDDRSDSSPHTAAYLPGAVLLDDVAEWFDRYLRFPHEHAIPVLALWAAHTWATSAFYVTPRLILDSPEPGSGKTRVLECLALVCRSAKLTLSTTTAALYRRIAAAGDTPPTVLQDEADAIFGKTSTPQTEELRALFNAGYKRGATVDRCEGDAKNMKVREFPVFAPVALAGLAGKMPATITTRAITIHMRRRRPSEHVAEFRERDAATEAHPLAARLEQWAAAHLDALTTARPTMPDGVQDRPAEVWEALIAIADAAGGDWPDRARRACRYFVCDTADNDEATSLGQRLLRDLKRIIGDAPSIASVDAVAKLTADDESEWADLWGKPLDQRRLARELKRYGVRSKVVRVGAFTPRGYTVIGDDGLGQAWATWLPQPSTEATSASQTTHSAAGAGSHSGHIPSGGATCETAETSQVKGDIHAQHVAQQERNARPGLHSLSGERNGSATTQNPSDQRERVDVAAVSAVALPDGTPARSTAPTTPNAMSTTRHTITPEGIESVSRSVLRRLAAQGPQTWSQLRRTLDASKRDLLGAACERLIEHGTITSAGSRYTLTPGTETAEPDPRQGDLFTEGGAA